MRWDSSVCIVTKVLRCAILCTRNILLFSAKCVDLLSGPTSPRFSAYRGFFPRGKAAGDMKLATYVDLEPTLRISVSIPLTPRAFTTCQGATLPATMSILSTFHNHNIQFFFNTALSTAERSSSSVAVYCVRNVMAHDDAREGK